MELVAVVICLGLWVVVYGGGLLANHPACRAVEDVNQPACGGETASDAQECVCGVDGGAEGEVA